MEHKLRYLKPEELMPQLEEILQQAQAVPLVISGSSMAPFLRHGRDTVYLSRVTEPLKRGDMILYRRRSGAYILHRILRAEEDVYTLVGDGQLLPEPGIRRDQVIAIVTAVRRKEKLLKPGSFLWEFFEHVWLGILPLRPYVLKLRGLIRPRK